MTRLTMGSDHWHYEPSVGLDLSLTLGPNDVEEPPTDEQLAAAWEVEREAMLDSCRRNPSPGWRPAAWWWFDAGEPAPESGAAEALRLVELGALWPGELERLREHALGALHDREAVDRAEDAGAVTTGPRGAAEAMRARRDRDAVAWRRVLEALEGTG